MTDENKKITALTDEALDGVSGGVEELYYGLIGCDVDDAVCSIGNETDMGTLNNPVGMKKGGGSLVFN